MRAACTLAGLAPDDPRWKTVAPGIADAVVRATPGEFVVWSACGLCRFACPCCRQAIEEGIQFLARPNPESERSWAAVGSGLRGERI